MRPSFVIISLRPALLAVPLLLAASGPARAQMGSGWVAYQPTSSIQLDGSDGIESYPGSSTDLRNEGASFTNLDGIETFALHDPISNRAERRMQNTYLMGRRQFEGEVRVSPPTNDESVMQIFGGNSGATTQMIRAYDVGGGTLRKVPGSVVLAENIHGVWIKVNVIHDIPANKVETYINGEPAGDRRRRGHQRGQRRLVPQIRLLRHPAHRLGQGRVAEREALPRRHRAPTQRRRPTPGHARRRHGRHPFRRRSPHPARCRRHRWLRRRRR